MNSISEQLLQAVDIVVEEKISKLNYDKTIPAEIYSIADIDKGEYKVKYTGNIFSAFSSDVTKKYSIGDTVYVTVPEGNFSNKKIINSLVSEQSLSYSQLQSLQQSVEKISPTFDTFYNYDASSAFGVIAGAPQGSENSYSYVYKGPDEYSNDQYHGLFQQYSSKYELIRIKASFLTNFHSEHSKGNYGIEIEFYTKSDGVVSYKLDLSSFNGDPYQYSVYSPQSVIIKAQKNYLLGVKSIKLFEENFEYDRYVVNGVITDKYNTTVANIFVKNIEIQYVEEKNLMDNTYYLSILAPKGNSLTSNINSIDLVGQLIYQGENILDSKTCVCEWFERDLSIMIGSDKYDKNAGFGWRKISGDFNLLSIDSFDVHYQNKYKLITIYNSTNVLTAEIEVFNLNGEYKYELKQNTNGDDISLQLVNNYNNELLLGDWYLSYPDGSYSSVSNGKKQNSILIKDYLLYTSVTFYCSVYSYDTIQVIGTIEKTITNSESANDIEISYTGEDTFRYDTNGDVAIEDSEKERTLQVALTWKDGVATSYRVEWIGPDGTQITNSRYTPSKSMIDNLWIDSSNILHYTIKQKYKVNFNNNTIQVKIITIDENVYTFSKEILFLKDGDQGTNGTTYVTAIRPCDINGNKLSGLQPLIYNNGWLNNLLLKCYVYKDGELLNNNPNYTLSYEWNGINISLNSSNASQVIANGQGIISNSSASVNLEFYVKVKVTVNDRMNNNATTEIYASYPIDVAVGGINYSLINIDDIPSYIKYTQSGLNPSFYSNNITFFYNQTNQTQYIQSLNTNLLEIENKDNLYYLKPASSFIFENKNNLDSNIGILKCPISNGQYLLHPVIMYLDTYGNEAINGWDGTKVDVNQTGGYIFAPQVGAGIKDSAGRFTGVVLGKDSGQNKIGLYGYQQGINTFGLMEDGKAFFGAKSGGGQIVLDGTSAMIYGGGNASQVGGDSANGMSIYLANLNPSNPSKQYAIKVGAGAFGVMYDGSVIATSADISGTIYAIAGKIGCSRKGSNDGWTIQTNRLYSGSGTNYVELNSATPTGVNNNDNYAIWAGNSTAISAKFSVTKGGLITAKEGSIGGWILTSNRFASDSNSIGMASSGTYRFWSGADRTTDSSKVPTFTGGSYFWVSSSGEMSCKNATVRGTIYADRGTIGEWTLSNGRLQNATGSIYLSTGGLKVGSDFYVSSSGRLTANSAFISGTIDAEEGYIGGWRITDDRLSAGSTRLYSDGRIRCDSLTAYDATISGNIDADYLTCYSGVIGGWNISNRGISSGYTSLSSSGLIETQQVDVYKGGLFLGYLGYVPGEDDYGLTDNIGIQTTDNGRSIILQSQRNIALRATGNGIWITAANIYFSGTVHGLDTTARFG